MEHTQIVTAEDLDDYSLRRDSEAVIPELIWMLVTASSPDITVCRIPYGDSINLPGLDGLVETQNGFRQFVPKGRSYWETGRGRDPQAKATIDYKKRTAEITATERKVTTFVFVTPHSKAWSYPSQNRWLKKRSTDNWQRMTILDGIQLADWLRDFPAIGKWLLNKIKPANSINGLETVAEHWELLSKITNKDDPPLPPQIFLAGRDSACAELTRLFRGEIPQILLGVESERDAEDFVAAFIESLEPNTRHAFSSKCLLISEADTWHTFANLKVSHVLVASPKLDLDSNERLLMTAKNNGHKVIIPISGAWANGKASLTPIRNPSKSALEKAFRDNGFTPQRASELAGAGAQNLAALKRHLLGLSELPPYATWGNARVLVLAGIIGKWNGMNEADRETIEAFLGKPYGEWIEIARGETLRLDTPLIQRNEKWKMISRGEAWSALGSWLTNDDLNRFQKLAISVLSEEDPKFDLPIEERFYSSIDGNKQFYSDSIREGVAESLALMGSKPAALSSCTLGKAERTTNNVVRELLHDANWKRWASLQSHLPLLAEAAPDSFLDAVENALLDPTKSPFLGVFSQESSGFGGWNYTSGLLWALETLAWHPDYLVKATSLLGELAAIDPGGNWANRPSNSLVDIFLPWHVQTTATISQRKAALEVLLHEQPDVGWTLLMRLLPTFHGVTSGTRKPVWRNFIPSDWKEGVTHGEYWEQVSNYAEFATAIAATDLDKLAELVDHLPDLPKPAFTKVLGHLCSNAVTSLSESSRLPLWESLVDLAAKHRKFATAQWAMPAEVVAKIEEAADILAPSSMTQLNRRLFSERDFDLYEENGDFKEQEQKLEKKRQEVIKEILSLNNIEGVLEFTSQVESPRKVGLALGSIESQNVDVYLLPNYLGKTDKAISSFVASFVWGRFWSYKYGWVDTQLSKGWSNQNILALLVLLPFDPETWRRAEQYLGNELDSYWKSVHANPWGLDQQHLFEAANKLISCGQYRTAVDCLYLLAHKKIVFTAELALQALMGSLSSLKESGLPDQHHVTEVIKWLQENEPEDSDELFQIEWNYLPLLNRIYDVAPKFMESRLANKPEFFCEVISAIFRSDKVDRTERETSENEKNIAKNAFQLLHGWRTIPGTMADGSFDGTRFSKWLSDVKRLTTDSGHFKIAMSQLGEALAYSPSDPNGLWIQKDIASALNAKDVPTMRSGFTVGLFNKRGVHGFSSGNEEKQIATEYREKAIALAENGFHRLADSIRNLAEDYEHQAQRESESDLFNE